MRNVTLLVVGSIGLLAVAGILRLERAQTNLQAQNQILQKTADEWARTTRAGALPSSGLRQPESNESSAEAQYRELLRLRGEAGLLRRQAEELQQLRADNLSLRSNLIARVLAYELPELNSTQVESYLAQRGRNAESLLAAYNVLRDKRLLQEALERFPNDPKVNLAAAVASQFTSQRRQWIDAFKQSAPDNALANYLSAQDYFKSGQAALAVQELTTAAGKARFDDYSGDSLRSAEEVYRTAGYSEAATEAAAWSRFENLALYPFSELRRSLGDAADRSRQAGDEESARATLQLGLQLGQRLADEPLGLKTETQELLGLSIQRRLLETMDPGSSYDSTGQNVKDRLTQLARRVAEIKEFSDPPAWDGYLLKSMSEEDLLSYFQRLKSSGEVEARRWAATRQTNH